MEKVKQKINKIKMKHKRLDSQVKMKVTDDRSNHLSFMDKISYK